MTGLLTMDAGFQTTVLQSCEVKFPNPPGGYAIFGDKGLLQATQESCAAWSEDNGDQREELTYPSNDLSAFAQEIEDFADYVGAGTATPPTISSTSRSKTPEAPRRATTECCAGAPGSALPALCGTAWTRTRGASTLVSAAPAALRSVIKIPGVAQSASELRRGWTTADAAVPSGNPDRQMAAHDRNSGSSLPAVLSIKFPISLYPLAFNHKCYYTNMLVF